MPVATLPLPTHTHLVHTQRLVLKTSLSSVTYTPAILSVGEPTLGQSEPNIPALEDSLVALLKEEASTQPIIMNQ